MPVRKRKGSPHWYIDIHPERARETIEAVFGTPAAQSIRQKSSKALKRKG
jgi:hypothetical protein